MQQPKTPSMGVNPSVDVGVADCICRTLAQSGQHALAECPEELECKGTRERFLSKDAVSGTSGSQGSGITLPRTDADLKTDVNAQIMNQLARQAPGISVL